MDEVLRESRGSDRSSAPQLPNRRCSNSSRHFVERCSYSDTAQLRVENLRPIPIISIQGLDRRLVAGHITPSIDPFLHPSSPTSPPHPLTPPHPSHHLPSSSAPRNNLAIYPPALPAPSFPKPPVRVSPASPPFGVCVSLSNLPTCC